MKRKAGADKIQRISTILIVFFLLLILLVVTLSAVCTQTDKWLHKHKHKQKRQLKILRISNRIANNRKMLLHTDENRFDL